MNQPASQLLPPPFSNQSLWVTPDQVLIVLSPLPTKKEPGLAKTPRRAALELHHRLAHSLPPFRMGLMALLGHFRRKEGAGGAEDALHPRIQMKSLAPMHH